MAAFLAQVIFLYILVLIARAVLSWFPHRPGTPMFSVYEFLVSITEPVLAPVRRALPPVGMFDVSFIVVIIGLQVLQTILARG